MIMTRFQSLAKELMSIMTACACYRSERVLGMTIRSIVYFGLWSAWLCIAHGANIFDFGAPGQREIAKRLRDQVF